MEFISYSEFQKYLKEGQIEKVSLISNRIAGKFKQPLPDGCTGFITIRVDPMLAKDLEQYPVEFRGA